MTTLTYSLIAGDLPPGVSIADTGQLVGTVLLDDVNRPQWQTPGGILGTFDELTEVSLAALAATPAAERTLQRYSVVNAHLGHRGLPWGVTLDPATGVISGTAAELLNDFSSPYDESVMPLWQTAAGKLGEFNEGETLDLSLSATPQNGQVISRYFTLKGALPWGLRLDPATGDIAGQVSELFAPEEVTPLAVTPKPLWTTPSGSLGTYDEKQAVSLTVAATARAGTAITRYHITAGGTPWGLTLHPTTGAISGTADEVKLPEPVDYLSGFPAWQTAEGSLGTLSTGQVVSLTLAAQGIGGRTITRYAMVTTAGQGLPWGLVFAPSTGAISGTVAPSAAGRTFEFTTVAVDSVGKEAARTFTLAVS